MAFFRQKKPKSENLKTYNLLECQFLYCGKLKEGCFLDDLQTRRTKPIDHHDIKMAHNCNCLSSQYLADMFTKCSHTTSYGLRSASHNNYFIPRPKNKFLKNKEKRVLSLSNDVKTDPLLTLLQSCLMFL